MAPIFLTYPYRTPYIVLACDRMPSEARIRKSRYTCNVPLVTLHVVGKRLRAAELRADILLLHEHGRFLCRLSGASDGSDKADCPRPAPPSWAALWFRGTSWNLYDCRQESSSDGEIAPFSIRGVNGYGRMG